jgi:uncharacterized surface protein with fasciclin (FAS1) repeats
MMKIFIKILHIFFIILISTCILFFTGCKEEVEPETFFEEEELLISDYLKEHIDEYSSLLRVLEITGIKPILNAYGHYTFFAPDDTAFEKYCQEKGCSGVDEFDTEFLKDLIKYHLLNVEIQTNFLPNGALPDTTYSGDNLVFTFSEGGIQTILINGESTIIERDIKVENGRIHKIDKVLDPVTVSMYAKLSDLDEYGIFSEALEITGLDDTLDIIYIPLTEDDNIRGRFTLFVESDEVFQNAGIQDISDLTDRFSDTPDPTDKQNGLYRFIAYHILPGKYFLNNLDSFNYATLAENKLINVKIENEIYLNYRQIEQEGDTSEFYVSILEDESNKGVKNGVYHSIDKMLEVYDPAPVYQIFEFTDYQGIEIKGVYSSKDFKYINGIETDNTGLWYRMSILDEDSSYLETTSNEVGWTVEFKLPVIVKGIYDIYLHWVSDKDRSEAAQVLWDDQPFPEQYSFHRKKRPPGGGSWMHNYRVCARLGTIVLSETKSHVLKFINLQEGVGVFDYISFHPKYL